MSYPRCGGGLRITGCDELPSPQRRFTHGERVSLNDCTVPRAAALGLWEWASPSRTWQRGGYLMPSPTSASYARLLGGWGYRRKWGTSRGRASVLGEQMRTRAASPSGRCVTSKTVIVKASRFGSYVVLTHSPSERMDT
ncbi:hypothetical protein NDU88_000259 [Pleurodeles waltl]|uniref:Uncharacterized protein n=1 Tax=Pleurodeles waltl TaxID=8319 RepID=A0AAV7LI16_PLEWA|nr:hypothetical protein NDU88_000259 [Pleurodeles waltl]